MVPGGNHAYPHRLFIQGARAQRTSLHRSVLMLKDCSPNRAALRPREPTLESPTLMRAAGAPGIEEPGQLAADNSKLLPLSLVRGSFLKTKFLIKCLLQLKCYFVKIFIPLCDMLDAHGCS